jgi:hypothetical protein
VPYNGTLDLSAIFSLEQAQGGTATLTYTIDRQPDFAEGTDEEYTSVEAYRATGNTLVSIQGVRVPDNVNVPDDNRLRVVREGKLKVSTVGSDITFTIVQTGKPALVPTIALDPEIDGLDNGTLTLTTTGQPRSFNATYFTISPIDFGISDIRVDIGEGAYITTSLGGVPQAGGSTGTPGTGGYIVAYHKDNTLEEVLTDETLPQARLYINVELQEVTAVGIELVETLPTLKANGNSARQPKQFIKILLSNGTSVTAASAGTDYGDFTVVTGHYSCTVGATPDLTTSGSGAGPYPADDTTSPWRIGNIKVNNTTMNVGTRVSFKISVAKINKGGNITEHLGELNWTLDVNAPTVE